ncbi:ribosomal protein S18 acetylase RimI-like enzyme [Hoeflea marina]|uniref:Ribosomal protein S18 acetylase RimI-like enzyme n=2 Tax=Hoeflea marina TaxID=274592 RepID=A0A317PI13_9HYPH|nr:ribosomal protein S18 acetylase RimI-like enzyme [Hoeflea marina]
MEFRRETADDLGFLSALYASTRGEELAPLAWSEAQKAHFLDMQFRAQHSHYARHFPNALRLIIEHLGKPVGRLCLEFRREEHRIIDVALVPMARGRGFGEALLRDVMDGAASNGVAVGIHVEKANPAMRLYRRLGFAVRQDKGVYDLLDWRPPQVNTAS